MTEKNILFIAPIPPPINGQSKASKVLLDSLCSKHNVEVIDLNKTSLKSGTGTILRVGQILVILLKIARLRKNKDVIYLSLAESFLGNLRDIAIYKLCSLFNGLEQDAIFYFLHTYYFECNQEADIMAVTDYGIKFASAAHHENKYGIQFHPEKSHQYGEILLHKFANFKSLC